jgi:predicted DCC family thiol-disulfide oxidoreductase YuxK
MESGAHASNNGWTGGQYSLYRVVFGTWLFVAFSNARTVSLGTLLWLVAVVFVVPFVLGYKDHVAAIALFGVMLVVIPLVDSTWTAHAATCIALLVHAWLPVAPYGSLTATGRPDPGNHWRFPPTAFQATHLLLALLYVFDGLVSILAVVGKSAPYQPLIGQAVDAIAPQMHAGMSVAVASVELGWGLLALLITWRLAFWLPMLALQLLIVALAHAAPFDFGLVALHLLAFDPAWIAPKEREASDLVFYDGSCGLCHRAVRFILAEDRDGNAFRFAPLGGETFLAAVDESRRATLPDSVAIVTAGGDLLTRSRAVLRILARLGGVWRLLGAVAGIIPPALLDALYDGVARIRYRLFAKPTDACPLIPKELRARFEA